MITFRCGRCAGWMGAGDKDAGTVVPCGRCGHANICPGPAGPPRLAAPPSRSSTLVVTLTSIAAVIVVAIAAWSLWPGRAGRDVSAPPAPATSPADARQQQILQQNLNQPGDPDLVERYLAIDGRYFSGALPRIAVRWEPALSDVGALASQAFTLQGMFGHVGKQLIILLNPSLEHDAPAIDRALCHEMVHAYLFTVGDTTTGHGPAFKTVLHRLSIEGAFEGIAATEEEKVNLRAWLAAESARLDAEKRDMDTIGREIGRERADVDRDLEALNARTAAANADGRSAAPSPEEIRDVEARRQSFNQRVAETNGRIERDRADLAHFNSEVSRYNLMMAYPDGLDESSLVPSKPALTGAGGR